jgi:hypothetical protein
MGERFLELFHDITFFSLAVLIVIIVPIVAILSGIIRLLFNLKKRNNVLSAFGWTIWSLALVFVIITAILGVNRVSLGFHNRNVKILDVPENKVLYLRLDEDDEFSNSRNYYTIFGKELIRDKWNDDYLLQPEISIKPSEDDVSRLQIDYSSLIPWDEDDMDYDLFHFTFRDTLLVIDNYWRVDDEELWRLPKLQLTLYIPEGQKIHIDPDFKKIQHSGFYDSSWPEWYYRNVLEMKEDSLILEK